MDGQTSRTAPRIHVALDDSLCPLCGENLGLDRKPMKPGKTLEVLGRHFASACPATMQSPP